MKSFIHQIVNLGWFPELKEKEARRLRILNSISVAVALISLINTVLNFSISNFLLAASCLIVCFLFILVIISNKLEKYQIAKIIFLSTPFLFAFSQGVLYGAALQIEYIFLMIPLMAFLLFDSKESHKFILTFTFFAFAGMKAIYHFATPILQVNNSILFQLIDAGAIILCSYILIQRFQIDSEKSHKKTQKLLQNLRDVNQKVTSKEEAIKEQSNKLWEEVQSRQKAIKAYNGSKRRYQLLFELAFDGIVIYDLNKRLPVTCNQKLLDFFEINKEELRSAQVLNFLEKNQKDKRTIEVIEKNILKVKSKGKITFESGFITKKGKRVTADVTAVLLPAPESHLAICIFKNITKASQAREKILATNQELKNFAHAASHDMKEPLRMINSFGQLLEQRNKEKLDEQSQEFLKFIMDASRRMTQMVQDLLEYATTGGNLEELNQVNLNEVILIVKNNLRLKMEETQASIYFLDLPIIKGHFTLFTQLFQNIISNCIKFKKNNTPPIITIEHKELSKFHQISISDNGIGIAPENKQKIFEAFIRLNSKEHFEGSGIGLATCKKIIEGYGGNIWVESIFNKGTTFYFTIPKKALPTQKQESMIATIASYN